MSFKAVSAAAVLASLLIGGCATQTPIPADSLVLGEVSHVLTRAEIREDRLGWEKVPDFYGSLMRWGYTDDQIDQGRLFAMHLGIFWHNTVSGIRRWRMDFAATPEGLHVEPGNIVEMNAGGNGVQRRILRVRAKTLAEGHCSYKEPPATASDLVRGVITTLGRVGPSGSASLYCQGIEQEGWTTLGTDTWQKPVNSLGTVAK